MISPVIKWSGSKRSQASEIAGLFPTHKRYFEPFVGGGSVLYQIARTSPTVAGDLCDPLIQLWKAIQSGPEELAANYEHEWMLLQERGPKHFYHVRDRFNHEWRPSDLMFLSRTCVNGLIRFNKAGQFNNSFHLSRPGIHPERLGKLIAEWSHTIQKTMFVSGDYQATTADAVEGDLVYLDPPYMNTKGRYYGLSTIDFQEFFSYLEDLNARGIYWVLSFDGARGTQKYEGIIPRDLYVEKRLIMSGNSAFKKVMGQATEMVAEALYTNYSTDLD